MIKPTLFLVTFALFLGFGSGCSSYYSVIKQTPPAGNMKQYQEINVGWLDLGERNYKKYGYEEKDKDNWITIVRDANLKSLPQYLKDFIPGKKVNTSKELKETPAKTGLVIQFTDVDYKQQTSTAGQILFGSMAGSDTLEVNVHFIDGPSGKKLYSSMISVTSEAGMGYGSMGFEGRINNTLYNLAQCIAEKTR